MNLTSEQVHAIREGEPVSVVPHEVGEECVLLRKDVFERIVKRATEDDLPSSLAISRTMAAISEDDDLESYQKYTR